MRKSSKEWNNGFKDEVTPTPISVKIGEVLTTTGNFSWQLGVTGIGIVTLLLMGQYLGLGLIISTLILIGLALIFEWIGYRLTSGLWIPPCVSETWLTQGV